MAQAMMQAVGINARIEVLEWATQLDRYNTGKYQISSFTFSSRIDPALSFEQFSGDKTAQPRKVWDDPQAQKLIDESFLESDPARRQALFDQLHALMLEQTPLLVLYNGADAWATGKRVQGFSVWEGKPRAWGTSIKPERDTVVGRHAGRRLAGRSPSSLTPGVARLRRKAMSARRAGQQQRGDRQHQRGPGQGRRRRRPATGRRRCRRPRWPRSRRWPGSIAPRRHRGRPPRPRPSAAGSANRRTPRPGRHRHIHRWRMRARKSQRQHGQRETDQAQQHQRAQPAVDQHPAGPHAGQRGHAERQQHPIRLSRQAGRAEQGAT